MTRMHVQSLLLLLVILCAGTPQLPAQQDDMPQGRGRKRIEELRRIKMIDAVDLTEEQSVRLFAREKDLLQAERSIATQREACIDKLANLASGGSETEIAAEVERLGNLSREMMTRRQEYLTSLKDILSPQQIARLIVFEHNFRRELREMVEQARNRPRR